MNEALIAAIAVIVAAIVSAAFGLVPYILRRGAAVSEAWAPLVEQLQVDNDALRVRLADMEAHLRWQSQEIQRQEELIKGNFRVSEEAINGLNRELELERREIRRLREWIKLLVKQLEDAGITPEPEPDNQGD